MSHTTVSLFLKLVPATLLTASVAIPAVARDGANNELVNLGHS